MLVGYLLYTRTRAPPPRGVVVLVVVRMNMDVMVSILIHERRLGKMPRVSASERRAVVLYGATS